MPRELIFNLQATTLLASQERLVHTDDRLVEAYQQDPDVSLLVAEPSRFAAARVVRRLQGESRPRLDGALGLYQPLRATRQDPTDVEAVRRAARRWEDGLRRRARRQGMLLPHVVICNPLLAGFVDLRWAASVVYLTHDDLATGAENAPWREAILRSYDRVRERGRPVVSVAEVMLQRIASPGPSLLLPNGVDVASFATVVAPAPELASLPRPLGIYAGTLEGRIDRSSLAALSEAIGSGTIVLVGQERSPATRALADGLGNVHFTGHVAPGRVPSYLAAADVGLIPHVENEVTVGMSPLKLYEYLAAGLPVVATDLPPMRDVSDRVLLAERGVAFGEALRRALAMGRADEAMRSRFAQANSWSARASALLAFCDEVAAGGGPAAVPAVPAR